jgi:iron complex outermembrane receptor protein
MRNVLIGAVSLWLLASVAGWAQADVGAAAVPGPAAATPSSGAGQVPLELVLFQEMPVMTNVASKTEEKVADAPGIITTYTKQDIALYGYYTIYELAAITPGWGYSSWWGERSLVTRGQMYAFEGAKHLILVDGIPVNFPLSYKAVDQEELPLYFADRVEFLSGPSSALYGTSAFLGVVNIHSKHLAEEGTRFESQATLGSADRMQRYMTNLITNSAAGEGIVSLGYFQKDASLAYCGTADDPQNRLYDEQKSVFLNSNYKVKQGWAQGLGLGLIYTDKTDGIDESWMGPFTMKDNRIEFKTLVPYLKYERDLLENLKLDGYVNGEWGQELGQFPLDTHHDQFYDYQKNVGGQEAMLEGKWQANSMVDGILGVNYDERYWLDDSYWYTTGIHGFSEEVNDTPNHIVTLSAFTQWRATFDVLKGLNCILGARADNGKFGDMNYFQLSPRVGVVQKITEEINAKVLYGTALRAPTLKEYARNVEAKFQMDGFGMDESVLPSSLKPESIQTLDVSATYDNKQWSGVLTCFVEKTKDALITNSLPNNVSFYTNTAGNTNDRGVEAALQYMFSNVVKAFANYSYSIAEDDNGFYSPDVPVSTASLGAYYKLPTSWYSSLFVAGKYISAYRVADTDLQSNPDGSFVLDAKLSSAIADNLRLDVQVKNAFNRQYELPQNGEPEVPQPGRNILVSLNMDL